MLNDNEMSIAPNVGAMHKYLTSIQRNPLYNRVRTKIGEIVDSAPGPSSARIVRKWEESVKSFLTPGVLFEELGFRYFGPIDGHDIDALVDTFDGGARASTGPRLVHVITQKGKGFPAGEQRARSGTRCRRATIRPPASSSRRRRRIPTYTAVFGKGLAELGDENDRTSSRSPRRCRAARAPARSRRRIPTRFFDVGIAEGHAVTFAAGLATRGLRPVVRDLLDVPAARATTTSSTTSRSSTLPVVFCDGSRGARRRGRRDAHGAVRHRLHARRARHDGHGAEGRHARCSALLRAGVEHDARPVLAALPARRRRPTPCPTIADDRRRRRTARGRCCATGSEVAILAVGTMVSTSLAAAEALAAEGLDVTVVNCRFLKPYDEVTLAAILADHRQILVVEEGTVVNGFGAYMAAVIERHDPDVRVHDARRARPHHLRGVARAAARGAAASTRRASRERVRALHESEALAG